MHLILESTYTIIRFIESKIISIQSENDYRNYAASGNGFKSRAVGRSKNIGRGEYLIVWWV